MFSHKNICFHLYIDKTCVWDVFSSSENPLKMDTRLIQTLWYAPSESVSTTVYNCMKIGPQTEEDRHNDKTMRTTNKQTKKNR